VKLAAAIVVVVAPALLAGCAPRRFVSNGRLNEDALATVRRRLPVVRGLAFTAPVPVLVMGPEDMRAALASAIEESYAPGDLERTEAVYVRLGLLPAVGTLRHALQRLYEEEGAGFYDPRRKRLVLASAALGRGGFWVDLLGVLTRRDLVGEFLVAHELTHALQDAHFGLPTTPEPLTDAHGDRLLARHALLEGDATLAGFAYTRGAALANGDLARVTRAVAEVPARLARQYPHLPELVRTTLAFQYHAGTAFAARALATGGWAALDRVEADPPESTEQVLHPERYYTVRDRPVTITLGGTWVLEAAGWTRTLEDTLGELQIRVLAGRFLAGPVAERVAAGWDGDRLRALGRGDDLVLVWMTAWDTGADATEFARALPDIAPEARVERRGDRVLVLLVPPEGGLDPRTLATRVWLDTRAST
jgi:hypothetical protein